jgi:hypothetical protein
MKNRFAILCVVAAIIFISGRANILAQTNSWTNSASGNWEDPYWSLGVLPGTNQTVLFTNSGVKVLTIGPNTAQNFPDAMNVQSITVSSPPDSGNILLLNYAGFETPLMATDLTIGSNSIMLAYASSIQLISDYGDLTIHGTFIQDAGTQISTTNAYVDGTYNLISGLLTVRELAIDVLGKFIQSGGTNACRLTLDVSGFGLLSSNNAPEYDLNGGEYDGEILIRNGGTFDQSGGVANDVHTGEFLGEGVDGHLVQSGGIFNGPTNSPLYIPAEEGFLEEIPIGSSAMQTGGTNQEYSLVIGLPLAAEYYANYNNQLQYDHCQGVSDSSGTYTLSNGMLITSGTSITANGDIEQSGGVDIVNGTLSLQGTLYYTFIYTAGFNEHWFVGCAQPAIYSLAGGFLSVSNLAVEGAGSVFQSGGTNVITGNLTLSTPTSQYGAAYPGTYDLSGGLLIASNISSGFGEFLQSGGRLVVGNLSVLNFIQTGGNIIQSGLFSLGSAMRVATGNQQFGQLQLDNIDLNPLSLTLPAGPSRIQFADSSPIAWASNYDLMIQNWSGSLYGGGSQQIIFGSNNLALTPQQLSQIQFQNPAGLALGNYPARILATGEIVPDTGAPLPPRVNLGSSNGVMRLSVGGDIGKTYAIEVSTDLVHWLTWTSQWNTNGTISIEDDGATNCPQRFYRAHAIP